jgi:hypothetical protein
VIDEARLLCGANHSVRHLCLIVAGAEAIRQGRKSLVSFEPRLSNHDSSLGHSFESAAGTIYSPTARQQSGDVDQDLGESRCVVAQQDRLIVR